MYHMLVLLVEVLLKMVEIKQITVLFPVEVMVLHF